MIMTESTFYTIEEVARMLKVSTETVRKLVTSGQLEAKRVGRQYRITQDALDKYLKG